MKKIIIFLSVLVSHYSCVNSNAKKIPNYSKAKISFDVSLDKVNIYEVNVKVINYGDSILTLSSPFKYSIVTFKIYDKLGIEYYPPRFRSLLNIKKEVIDIKPKEEIYGKFDLNIDAYEGKSEIKNWHKIIAYYRYYAYENGTNIITDTLINNQ